MCLLMSHSVASILITTEKQCNRVRVATGQGKVREIQGQGKAREFRISQGNFEFC